MLWTALSFMTALAGGQPCVIQVVRVSGTIKKSEEEAIRRARLAILRADVAPGRSDPAEQPPTLTDMAGIIDNDDDDDDEND